MLKFKGLLLLVIVGCTFLAQTVNAIRCGDGSICPAGSTCCPLDDDHFGCCPIPDAVCCEDHLHCCPNGMTCDTAHGKCLNEHGRVPMQRKFKAQRNDESNDDSSSSADESTNNRDKIERNDEANEEQHEQSRDWYDQFESMRVSHKSGISLQSSIRECSNGDTCGGLSTCCHDHRQNEAYCCPHRKGTCCHHGHKCCSKGFKCSAYGYECVREENGVHISMQMTSTKLGRANDKSANNDETTRTQCPDKSYCASANTCCPLRRHIDGPISGYRCCPLTKANCCENHCCPMNYHCHNGRRCVKTTLSQLLDEMKN